LDQGVALEDGSESTKVRRSPARGCWNPAQLGAGQARADRTREGAFNGDQQGPGTRSQSPRGMKAEDPRGSMRKIRATCSMNRWKRLTPSFIRVPLSERFGRMLFKAGVEISADELKESERHEAPADRGPRKA